VVSLLRGNFFWSVTKKPDTDILIIEIEYAAMTQGAISYRWSGSNLFCINLWAF